MQEEGQRSARHLRHADATDARTLGSIQTTAASFELSPQNAVGVPSTVLLQVSLRVAPRLTIRAAVRFGGEVGWATTMKFSPRVTSQPDPLFVIRISRGAAESIHLQTTIRFTPRTVPGTVRRVVLRMSFLQERWFPHLVCQPRVHPLVRVAPVALTSRTAGLQYRDGIRVRGPGGTPMSELPARSAMFGARAHPRRTACGPKRVK